MLTAAHCTYDRYISSVMFPSAIEVLVGEHDVMDSVPATRLKVCNLFVDYLFLWIQKQKPFFMSSNSFCMLITAGLQHQEP